MAPSAAAVTTPAGETVARLGFDDCHVARLVTSTVEPSLWVASAKSWRVSPGTNCAEPLPGTPTRIETMDTAGVEGAAGGEVLPHPVASASDVKATVKRRFIG